MRLPKVKIVNDATGKTKKVNQIEYANDLGLGKFIGWSLAGEIRGEFNESDQVLANNDQAIHSPKTFEEGGWEVAAEAESIVVTPSEEVTTSDKIELVENSDNQEVQNEVAESDAKQKVQPKRGRGKRKKEEE